MSTYEETQGKQGWMVVAALAGLTGVALGAFGAHGLKNILNASETTLWSKAVFYHLTHAVALLSVAFHVKQPRETRYDHTMWGFSLGILLFSGSLYLLALTGWRWLVWLTPLGGTLFLWGWLWLIVKSISRR